MFENDDILFEVLNILYNTTLVFQGQDHAFIVFSQMFPKGVQPQNNRT